jgi:hypothetical protein
MNDRGGYWVTRHSSRGNIFRAWVFAMPRIDDPYLECVVYLYPDRPRAEAGESFGGSGFIVGLPVPGHANHYEPVAVTNRHVVEHGNMTVRINTTDGGIDIVELDARHWLYHPDDVDLAIAPLSGLSFDKHAIRFVVPEHFLTEQVSAAMRIGVGDECFVVGRFINHEGRQRNAPSVRFGEIAQMLGEKIRFDEGPDQECYLVEARSLAGYSGSPTFVFIPPFDGSGVGRGNTTWRRGPWLLGIDVGHLFARERVLDRKTGKPGKSGLVRSQQHGHDGRDTSVALSRDVRVA